MNFSPRKCCICGKEFMPTSNSQKTCGPECKRIRKTQQHRDFKCRKYGLPMAIFQENYEKSIDATNEILKKAAARHMSYGKYMDALYRGIIND